ncbi:hypothetical protein EJ06DRAFT_123071 [Trichodelitschia bisporula]|uniref:Uncharacterized protein n=1 Tax=Trichodelitschia bisporula TaxID=703511 RepID=A0A6G1HQE6_9PEZI|nr:hypothetical protein EJ06DRAFT_123071 [Trichodelitschia bisporula]
MYHDIHDRNLPYQHRQREGTGGRRGPMSKARIKASTNHESALSSCLGAPSSCLRAKTPRHPLAHETRYPHAPGRQPSRHPAADTADTNPHHPHTCSSQGRGAGGERRLFQRQGLGRGSGMMGCLSDDMEVCGLWVVGRARLKGEEDLLVDDDAGLGLG